MTDLENLPFHIKRSFDLLKESGNEYRDKEQREQMMKLSQLNAIIAQAAALTRIAEALELLVSNFAGVKDKSNF